MLKEMIGIFKASLLDEPGFADDYAQIAPNFKLAQSFYEIGDEVRAEPKLGLFFVSFIHESVGLPVDQKKIQLSFGSFSIMRCVITLPPQ
jgi:hypothetical protein